jgi:SAM-dependent methyltransferase
MDRVTRKQWDSAAARYDLLVRGPEIRWAEYKRTFFAPMQGKVLFLAAGTGLDFQFFPPNQRVTAIDISPKMLEKAAPRAEQYDGTIDLKEMDVHDLRSPGSASFPDESFDQVFSVCTFCSVPNPVHGLEQLRRVLKPGGQLRMFEHTGSRWFPFNLILNLMTPITRLSGPELNRPTVENVARAGFTVQRVNNLYLDVVKTIEAIRSQSASDGSSVRAQSASDGSAGEQ